MTIHDENISNKIDIFVTENTYYIDVKMRQTTLGQLEGWAVTSRGLADFIYDPDILHAEFVNMTDEQRKKYCMVCTSDSIRMWIKSDTDMRPWKPRVMKKKCSVPLLKSHVQKAIRRKDYLSAREGVLALLTLDPDQILRRLGVIAVEDVCLTRGFSVLTWLMMASKARPLTKQDVVFLVGYTMCLCHVNTVYNHRRIEPAYRPEIERIEHGSRSEILALFHRTRYGGMKGDIQLLRDATSYYTRSPWEVVDLDISLNPGIRIDLVAQRIPILNAAIDFHPFPKIVMMISNETSIAPSRVKRLIWEIESAYNERKESTKLKSRRACLEEGSECVMSSLGKIRRQIVDEWVI
jgi:hypothetical protein